MPPAPPWFLELTHDELVQVIVAGFGVLTAITTTIGILLEKGRRAAKASRADIREVKEQVKNNHSTNLREESDSRHGETTSKLDTALEMIANMQRSQGWLYDLIAGNTHRLDDLEDTLTTTNGKHRTND